MLNVLISGVGGQGLLTLSRILGQAALSKGFKTYIAETHGMSQRGGSVSVFLRIGEDVMAPLPPEDDVNLHISMELIEAVRYSITHNERTVVVVNNKVIRPSLPGVRIPSIDDMLEALKKSTRNLYVTDASDASLRLGSTIGANIVMLGFVTYLLDKSSILSKDLVLGKVLELGSRELNARLFEAGYLDATGKVTQETIDYLVNVMKNAGSG